MDFSKTIPYLFGQTSTFFKVEVEKELNEFNLHAGQVFILFELWKNDGLSQIELSNNLRISPPTVNKMVKSLAKNDFVVTAPCRKDGRVMRVYLTMMGAAIRPRVEEKWHKLEEKLVGNLTSSEQIVLMQLFGKVLDNLLERNITVS